MLMLHTNNASNIYHLATNPSPHPPPEKKTYAQTNNQYFIKLIKHITYGQNMFHKKAKKI